MTDLITRMFDEAFALERAAPALPPLDEHDDWLYIAQCLLWLADRDPANARCRRLGNSIMTMCGQDDL